MSFSKGASTQERRGGVRDAGWQPTAAHLKVYNRETGRELGSIGNISERGLMIISKFPLMIGVNFALRIKLSEPRLVASSSEGGERHIDFDAVSHWSREDVDPAYYDSGLSVSHEQHQRVLDLAGELKHYFSFR